MASFMTKKKKYKFHVEICLEELLEVPFVSAVLFAKMRLLDGGSFQDHSSRQEVRDHKVLWGDSFSFPCKMTANAATGVMERCALRISVRKESKGGRSFDKLGFVDLDLAGFAGAGLVRKRALLEGYDARHRQDNSLLKFHIELSMTSGDVLFKAPSPSLKHKQLNDEDASNDPRSEDVSSGSLAGSIASGSSGFGSLPKKRPALLSEMVAGEPDPPEAPPQPDDRPSEHGHSRNSSNTSQLSKVSGYSSVHSRSHSRQSSAGDSGHVRDPPSRANRKRHPTNGHPHPRKPTIPRTIPCEPPPATSTPLKHAPAEAQSSVLSGSSNDEYASASDVFFGELHKSRSTSVVTCEPPPQQEAGVLRSKSDFQIPARSFFGSEGVFFSFLTPGPARKATAPPPPPTASPLPVPKTTSLGSLRTGGDWLAAARPAHRTAPHHRKLLDGAPASKLAPLAISPDEPPPDEDAPNLQAPRCPSVSTSASTNPSACSLVVSETGSLDRAKATYERRKKVQIQDAESAAVSGRVEITRVDPDNLIEELLKSTNLEQPDDSAETSGLQLFIAKDGTAAVGNHEVKSQMSTGAQVFKQVVMDNR